MHKRTGRAEHRARGRAAAGGSTCCFWTMISQCVARVRHLAGERLVEHHADAVPVRRLADLAAAGLLRRHVLDRADRAVRDRLLRRIERRHEAEVEDHDAPLARDHHVRGLDVAVDEAGRRAARTSPTTSWRSAARSRSLSPRTCSRKWPPVDELHREEPQVAVAHQLAERDQVRVRGRLQRAELALEARERVAVGARQGLDRDHVVAIAIERFEDLAHPARAEPAPYFEAPPQDVTCKDQRTVHSTGEPRVPLLAGVRTPRSPRDAAGDVVTHTAPVDIRTRP